MLSIVYNPHISGQSTASSSPPDNTMKVSVSTDTTGGKLSAESEDSQIKNESKNNLLPSMEAKPETESGSVDVAKDGSALCAEEPRNTNISVRDTKIDSVQNSIHDDKTDLIEKEKIKRLSLNPAQNQFISSFFMGVSFQKDLYVADLTQAIQV